MSYDEELFAANVAAGVPPQTVVGASCLNTSSGCKIQNFLTTDDTDDTDKK